ncbi:hypothetical protein SHIRM173S_00152 [Streptomyces hirsutus]
MGSEGECGVVAGNLSDFLWMLADGVGPLESVLYEEHKSRPDAHLTQLAERHAAGAPPGPGHHHRGPCRVPLHQRHRGTLPLSREGRSTGASRVSLSNAATAGTTGMAYHRLRSHSALTNTHVSSAITTENAKPKPAAKPKWVTAC